MAQIPFSKDKLLKVYADILLVRLCEQQIQKEYFQDEMKTPVHLGIGGEAVTVGVYHCLPANSPLFGTYRNHAAYLTASHDTDGFFGEMYGRVNGCAKGKAGSMHMSCPEAGLIATSAVVATTVPMAVGAAFAHRYQGHEKVVTVFFGDGAIEEGVFWESLNFACLHKLPVLFVCEDNDLAIHTFRKAREGFVSIEKAVSGFDCLFAQGDGTDVEHVMTTTQSLLASMKKENKPGFIQLNYFRFLEHVGPLEDFKFGYRAKPEAAHSKDPVTNCEQMLLKQGVAQAEMDTIRHRLLGQIEASVQKAKAAPFADASELYSDVFA